MHFNTFRRLAYEIHLWLGIAGGIVVFLVCLSGSIYVFREEIQRLAEPTKYYVDVPQSSERLPIDTLVDMVESANPDMNVVFLAIPEGKNRTVRMTLAFDDRGGRAVCYVNPYTGDLTGQGGNVVDLFFASVLRLHRYLWLPPRTGRLIVGIATLVFVVVCLTGLVLWLPRTWSSFKKWRAWKPGFQIRVRKGVWPLMYDLHNTVGFYLLIPVLLMALTGLCWSFSWYRQGASALLGEQIFRRLPGPEAVEPFDGSLKPLTVGEVIAKHRELSPGSGELTVSIPRDSETAMLVQQSRSGLFSLAVKDKTQWDRFRRTVIPVEHYGKTVVVERFSDKPLGVKIASTVRAVHVGDITGISSKIVFFIACLFATSFPVTGVALWTKKLLVKYRKRKIVQDSAVHSGTVQAMSHLPPAPQDATNVGQSI